MRPWGCGPGRGRATVPARGSSSSLVWVLDWAAAWVFPGGPPPHPQSALARRRSGPDALPQCCPDWTSGDPRTVGRLAPVHVHPPAPALVCGPERWAGPGPERLGLRLASVLHSVWLLSALLRFPTSCCLASTWSCTARQTEPWPPQRAIRRPVGGAPILSPRGDGGFRVCGPGTRLPWRPARGGTDRPFRARGQGVCRAHPWR